VKSARVECLGVLHDPWHKADITPHIVIARTPFLTPTLNAVTVMNDARFRRHRDEVFRHFFYLSITERFSYPDNSAEAVYSSQLLPNLAIENAECCHNMVYYVQK
jgi:hypothetical protein